MGNPLVKQGVSNWLKAAKATLRLRTTILLYDARSQLVKTGEALQADEKAQDPSDTEDDSLDDYVLKEKNLARGMQGVGVNDDSPSVLDLKADTAVVEGIVHHFCF